MDSPDSPWLEGMQSTTALGPGALGAFSFNREYLNWLKENAGRFDILIAHGLWDFVSLAAILAAAQKSVPVFVFVHGMLDPWFNEAYPLKRLKKQIYWFFLQAPVLARARAVLFNSEQEMLRARNVFLPYKFRELLVPYGVLPCKLEKERAIQVFFEKFSALKGKNYFLFFGRVTAKKGLELLLKSFANLRPEGYEIVIAGPRDSSYAESLNALAAELGIEEHLHWTGMLSDQLKWGALSAADLFVLTSKQENFARAMAESLAVGTPVLISEQVNTWSIINKYNAGLLCQAEQESTQKALQQW
ncbi:MAG: glycosyltransferase, partial [Candidatus Obscuribacterales bacterium]|nr:glycosyltransferase [Candidatus Obscuribacterales bacterium]